MRLIILFFLLPIFLAGCSDSRPSQLQAAWLGEGQYSSSAGNADVKAQLEILDNGTYRFLILEPRVLMLAGMEEGTWAEAGGKVDLTPVEKPAGEKRSGLFSTTPRNFRPKTLTVEGDYSKLVISDDEFEMDFLLNEKATDKLVENGEITY